MHRQLRRCASVARVRVARSDGLKGSGQTFRVPSAFEIRPHERWARFPSYPDAEQLSIFDKSSDWTRRALARLRQMACPITALRATFDEAIEDDWAACRRASSNSSVAFSPTPSNNRESSLR